MPQRTDIEWTDYTSNPLKLRLRKSGKLVNACIKCSPGCSSCYAEAITRRYWPQEEGKFPGYSLPLMKLGDIVLNDAEIQKLLRFRPKPPFRNGDTPMLFIEDMSDIAGEFVPFELLDKLFAVFALRPDVVFQVLTKRPERMAQYFAGLDCEDAHDIAGIDAGYRIGTAAGCLLDGDWIWGEGKRHRRKIEEFIADTHNDISGFEDEDDPYELKPVPWPLPNVWLGTSCEDQQRADERIPELLRCSAAVRFLSCEPLLGPIDLRNISLGTGESIDDADGSPQDFTFDSLNGTVPGGLKIDWCIIGGESGRGARPCNVEWIRSIAAQCREIDVPVFVKQLGKWIDDGRGGTSEKTKEFCVQRFLLSDGSTWVPPMLRAQYHPQAYDERPLNAVAFGLADAKGGDPSEWPKDLRVRQMPDQRREAAATQGS